MAIVLSAKSQCWIAVVLKCSICETEIDPDEGGTEGYFGMIPVAFCVNCLAGVVSLAEHFCERCIEDE